MKIIQWVLTSSADPDKLSLTVKGALLALLPIIMLITGLDDGTADEMINTIVNIVFYGLSLVSSIGVFYGFIRKIWLTFAKE